METIKNYLETMFQNLPNTPEVRKAKIELGQMMEDKYTELLQEGKSENEAVGTIISEFGNLEELAESLGIKEIVKEEKETPRRIVTLDETKEFIKDKIQHAYFIAFGVLLCILSPCGCILFDYYAPALEVVIGCTLLFVLVAVGVGMFVFSGLSMGKWGFMDNELCSVEMKTAEYIRIEQERFRMAKIGRITIGVILCIISVIPVMVINEIEAIAEVWEGISVVFMFVAVAIAVFLFVSAGIQNGSYEKLLSLSQFQSMNTFYPRQQKRITHYKNKTVESIMSVYWPTITCIYLCWSFLSYDWHITWIIWVIASVIEMYIKAVFKE
ncbi:MAG: hypothetical protein HFJ09_14735 [Lachnospiraceae bacterium]|nr:hypothetical protein [Lachnospiraceae bacterium]